VRQILKGRERSEDLSSKRLLLFSIPFFVCLDLLCKHLAETHLVEYGEPMPFIPFINLMLAYNSGIAFSLLDLNNFFTKYILVIVGIILVIFLFRLYFKEDKILSCLSLMLIISGALGNIFDRIPDGVVTDFLELNIFNNTIFIFNLADAFISVGAVCFFASEFHRFLRNRHHAK